MTGWIVFAATLGTLVLAMMITGIREEARKQRARDTREALREAARRAREMPRHDPAELWGYLASRTPSARMKIASWQGDPPQMRCTDADRDLVLGVLRDGLERGSLDQGEWERRMSRAMSAQTRKLLAGLTRDLPA